MTAEPFISRIVGAGNGSVAAHYAADLHRTEPIIEYVADARLGARRIRRPSRRSARRSPRRAEIVNADHDKAAEAQARFTKMNVDLVKKYPPSVVQARAEGPRISPGGSR